MKCAPCGDSTSISADVERRIYCKFQRSKYHVVLQGLPVAEVDTTWTELASRVIRVALARKNFSREKLATSLHSLGIDQTDKTLSSRVSRGHLRADFFLQVLTATQAVPPGLWKDALAVNTSWEAKTSAVLQAELSRHPTVSMEELARRLKNDFGADVSEKTLVTRLSNGTLTLPEFLQCILALGSCSLDQFIEYEDLVRAATNSAKASI